MMGYNITSIEELSSKRHNYNKIKTDSKNSNNIEDFEKILPLHIHGAMLAKQIHQKPLV